MRREIIPLPMPTVDGTTAIGITIAHLRGCAVFVDEATTMTAELSVEAKASGTGDASSDGWHTLGTVSSDNTVVPVPDYFTHVRIKRTTMGSTPKARVSGFLGRSE